jgi:hypothetical protein
MNIRCQVRSPCLSLEQEIFTLPEPMSSPSVLCGVRVARSLVFCVIICRSLFALMFFFIWQLCCLFFDLRLLIDPLVSLCFLFIPRPLCVLIFVQPLNHIVFFLSFMLFNILLEHLLITFVFMIAVYSDWFYSQFYVKGED